MAALEQVTTDIWRMRYRVSVLPGFILPTHMTIVRQPDGALWIHAPVELDLAAQAELDALGKVTHIVAPNLFHHKWFATTAELYPMARPHAPQALARKVSSAPKFTPLSCDHQAFAPCLETHHIAGLTSVDEFVFYHPKSRTLIVTDLAFNMNGCDGLLTPLILTLAGTRSGLRCSRLIKSQIVDKAALERSLQEVLRLDIERVMLAHGDLVEGDAKQRLATACQRLVS